jgi:hypothetical protein
MVRGGGKEGFFRPCSSGRAEDVRCPSRLSGAAVNTDSTPPAASGVFQASYATVNNEPMGDGFILIF